MSKALFDNSDVSDDEFDFKTNKDYAKSYNTFRQKELLKKLKDKEAGNDSDSSSDSDSSEDDEIAFNPKFDNEFYKTLSSLKRKDPTIYDKSTKFFDENSNNADTDADQSSPKKKRKKLTIKQYEQDLLLKKCGVFDEESDDENKNNNKRSQSPTYNEEQKMIKNEILGKVEIIDESEGENDIGGLFSKREMTKKEKEEDDEEQDKWLVEHNEIKEKSINDIWSNKKLSKDEKFLRDYILSNGYADKDDDEIPTYDEIVGDDDFEEKQTEFEHKYNFRFEDPDQEFIKRYPRTIEHSVRKTDTRRKEKRAERKERKEIEKKEKFQEIEMLKEMKRKEIEEKIEKLKAVTGTDDLNVDEMDLDGDFDPIEYDKKMQAIFNSEYYEVDEGDEKPKAPSDIEDLQVENYDEIDDDNTNTDKHCEDNDFNMDCDYDETHNNQEKSFQDEMIDSTRKRKRGKRKSKFMEMLEADKPKFDPTDEKTFGEYLDEYYKLDCEDIIGDVKCRFKYVETTPCDYGLTIDEILGAKNKELNAWASLKKATQIRPEHVERNEQMIFQRKSKNEALKRKILQSLYESSDDESELEKSPILVENNKPMTKLENALSQIRDGETRSSGENAKNKKKKKKKSGMNMSTGTSISVASTSAIEVHHTDEKKVEQFSQKQPTEETKPQSEVKPVEKFKAKHKVSLKVAHKTIDNRNKTNKIIKRKGLSDERLKAFGINPKKFIKQQKYGSQNQHKIGDSKISPTKNEKFKNKMKNKLKKALQK